MEFVEKLLAKTDYLKLVQSLELLETERQFCRHGLAHFLDVARIAWIQVLEQNGNSPEWKGIPADSEEGGLQEGFTEEKMILYKEKIYLAALLHDLGRIAEYEKQVPHHQAGVEIAQRLLREIDYPEQETMEILKAIEGHRGSEKPAAGEGKVSPVDSRYQKTEEGKADAPSPQKELKNKLNIDFIKLIKEADNKSRNCFYCEAQETCKWSQERRNHSIAW